MPNESETPVRKPVGLGCAFALVIAFALAMGAAFVLIFLDSGADDGTVLLDALETYQVGTATFVPGRNVYVVRLSSTDLFALSDLDAANREALGRRCRVALLGSDSQLGPRLLERFRSRLSKEAERTTLLFWEECNGAVYDIKGVRLDADGRNLDRLALRVDDRGFVVVNVNDRICTRREGSDFAILGDC